MKEIIFLYTSICNGENKWCDDVEYSKTRKKEKKSQRKQMFNFTHVWREAYGVFGTPFQKKKNTHMFSNNITDISTHIVIHMYFHTWFQTTKHMFLSACTKHSLNCLFNWHMLILQALQKEDQTIFQNLLDPLETIACFHEKSMKYGCILGFRCERGCGTW